MVLGRKANLPVAVDLSGTSKKPGSMDRYYGYKIYGIPVRSPLLLHAPSITGRGPEHSDLEVNWKTSLALSAADRARLVAPGKLRWFRCLDLPDGQTYLKWEGLFEFLVSGDGRRIDVHPLEDSTWESFQDYLLGQALSFALLKQGIESLHATVLVREGKAVGFLGACGQGKSTLAAAFLQAGYRLLTDDMLVVQEAPGEIIAFPGLPRIKLFPEMARSLLGEGVRGTPMNHLTTKLLIPLAAGQFCRQPTPLKALYVVRPPGPRSRVKRVTLRSLTRRQGFLALTANTFNAVIKDPDRLRRQFAFAARLASRLPLKSLSYPWDLSRLPEVVAKIQRDVFYNKLQSVDNIRPELP